MFKMCIISMNLATKLDLDYPLEELGKLSEEDAELLFRTDLDNTGEAGHLPFSTNKLQYDEDSAQPILMKSKVMK